jgi:hypothetical protein
VTILTRLVGAFDAIILSLTAAVTVVMVVTLLDPSLVPAESMVRHGTVTIQQLALDEASSVRHM